MHMEKCFKTANMASGFSKINVRNVNKTTPPFICIYLHAATLSSRYMAAIFSLLTAWMISAGSENVKGQFHRISHTISKNGTKGTSRLSKCLQTYPQIRDHLHLIYRERVLAYLHEILVAPLRYLPLQIRADFRASTTPDPSVPVLV